MPRAPRQVTPGIFKIKLDPAPPGQVPDPDAKKPEGQPRRGRAPGAGVTKGRPGAGRPAAGQSFAELIAKEFEKYVAEYTDEESSEEDDPTVKQAIVRKFVRQALGGNLMTFIELMNRTEGKVADKTQMDVTHTMRVVPWDDDDAPGIVYQENRGLGEKDESKEPPDVALRDVPALPPPQDTGNDGSDGDEG